MSTESEKDSSLLEELRRKRMDDTGQDGRPRTNYPAAQDLLLEKLKSKHPEKEPKS
jgi:hypothetical protein